MRAAYFQCIGGASGDMVLSAIVDAGVPLAVITSALDAMNVTGVALSAEQSQRGGVVGTYVRVELDESVVGAALAGDDLQQRGLAGAVVADQPDALFRPDEKGHLIEHFLAAIADGDVVDV